MEAETSGAGLSSSNGSNKKGVKQRNLSESTRIKFTQILEQFQKSNAEVHKFEDNLTRKERAALHKLCRKMGMKSKSEGREANRRLSVFKKKKKPITLEREKNLDSFTFSKESKEVLQDLFARYPPDEGETGEYKFDNANIRKERGRSDDIFIRPFMNKSEITKKIESFAESVDKNLNMRQMMEGRSKLPIASFKDTILSTLESYQVVLISGETGCGKTTQVPQYLLDYMWAKGEACKVVCTQPRRISAISVSERISTERGENVGDTVGYKIRLEKTGGRHSSIVFCTNGILLRIFVGRGKIRSDRGTSRKLVKDELAEITHIIVDEIHERDRFSDFLLAVIRDILPFYPHLRLILMSATLDAERFSTYFGGCPVIRVPGFTYPVKSFYLEDILALVKSPNDSHHDTSTVTVTDEGTVLTEEYRTALDEAINMALSNDEFDPLLELISSGVSEVFNYQHSATGVTSLMVFAAKGRVGDICMLLSLGADCNIQANDGSTALNWAERENQGEAAEIIKKHMEKALDNSQEKQQLLEKYMSNCDPELIDYVLIEQLLRRICSDSQYGAILIFFPGWDDIARTRDRLQGSSFFKDTSKFLVLPLHSRVPAAEQKSVFNRPPPGCRKIILSTNIAETAVTIDDVVYVIDSGRMKEKNYDPYNNVTTLESSWVSKASAKQREGRAGRCQPGICYHLYSKLRADSLPAFQVPEINRIPIEELCLQVKLLDPDCKIEYCLQKTLDPPVYETIRNAIVVLQDLGALSLDEKLTELGEKLGSLPVHPLTSRMLLIAILFNCLDPALTLACAADYRDPFTIPMLPNDKKKAEAAKSELAALYGGSGDQLAVVAAFDCWRKAKEKGQAARFCSEYFVSSGTMNMISRMRTQLQSELERIGFIPKDASQCNSNARNAGILHAVLVAGLYPMVGRLLPPLRGGGRSVVETSGGDKVRLHTFSINFKLSFKKLKNRPLIIYDEITRGNGGLHIRNSSVVGPLPLLLLATEIVVAPVSDNDDDEDEGNDGSDYDETDDDGECDEGKMETNDASDVRRGKKIMSSPDNIVNVITDRWLPYESTALDVAQIYCLRERLSAAMLYKVKHPWKVLPEVLAESVYSITRILSYDGMSGVAQQEGQNQNRRRLLNLLMSDKKKSVTSVIRREDEDEDDPPTEVTPLDQEAMAQPTRLELLYQRGMSRSRRFMNQKGMSQPSKVMPHHQKGLRQPTEVMPRDQKAMSQPTRLELLYQRGMSWSRRFMNHNSRKFLNPQVHVTPVVSAHGAAATPASRRE